MKSLRFALFLLLVNSPVLRADEAEDKSVAAIEEVGGVFDRDSKRTGAGLIVLANLGAIGIGGNLLVAFGAAANARTLTPLFAIGLAIAFLAAVATGIMFLRTRHDPSARGVRRVIFGTLALTGGLILAAIVVALAVIIFVLVACFASSPGFR